MTILWYVGKRGITISKVEKAIEKNALSLRVFMKKNYCVSKESIEDASLLMCQ